MPKIVIETPIDASPQAVFDLSRDVGLHCQTLRHTGERAVDGTTSGRLGLDDWVTFEAKHFGVRQRLTVKIIEMNAPHSFVGITTKGIFKSMRHLHEFEEAPGGGTLMRDTLEWLSPLGPLGVIANVVTVGRHMKGLLTKRNAALKEVAEGRAPERAGKQPKRRKAV